jgi:hypothetical protein
VTAPEVTVTATRRAAFLPERYAASLILAECRRLDRHARVSADARRAAS